LIASFGRRAINSLSPRQLKPKHDITVLPEIASHFDGLHVDEKEVITRFLQTLKQLGREKRRR
jgi:hypothetical protein